MGMSQKNTTNKGLMFSPLLKEGGDVVAADQKSTR